MPVGAISKDQVGFLENHGQVRDFKGQKVKDVLYSAVLGGQKICITNKGLSILLSRVINTNKVARQKSLATEKFDRHTDDSILSTSFELERIDISLEGALIQQENIETTEDETSPLYYLYMDANSANNPPLRLKKEVLVKNVYPGIDWRLSISAGKGKAPVMKYDFIVHPGADALKIQLRYSKNCKVELEGEELVGKSKMGIIKEEKPYSFLQGTGDEVIVKYKTKNNRLQFQVNQYDRNKTLVIDPTIYWLTYISSNNAVTQSQSIAGKDVETDRAGNIFVQFSAQRSASFPTVNPGGGAYYQEYTSSPDGSMMIMKFSPGGQLLWCTYYGNWVGGMMMTIDKDDNIIAIGVDLGIANSLPYSDATIPLLDNGGYYQASNKSYFIAKFSNSGELKWSSWFLSFGSNPMDMTYDQSGNFYVTGSSDDSEFPTVDPGGGAYVVNQPQYRASEVLFIAQFDLQNKLTWSTRIEGNSLDPYARICTDLKGNIYLGGRVRSTNFPLVDTGGFFNNSGWGSVLARFNPNRQLTWSTYIPGHFSFADLTTDDSSNLYVITAPKILKFDKNTNLVFETSIPTNRMYFWQKINYDRHSGNVQLLGVMNDQYMEFPTVNTECNGSFFHDGQFPRTYMNMTGPIFATIDPAGKFSYLSLADWKYEYYHHNEMTVDAQGNLIYVFGYIINSHLDPNPQLTNPGNGAYFDSQCCYQFGSLSSIIMKLTPSELSVNIEKTDANGCNCNGTARAVVLCGQAPFRYWWSTGDTTESVTGLCPGNYQLKVTDANNLSRNLTVNIPYPPESIKGVSVSTTPESCDRSNGQIFVENIDGGSVPYNYSLDGGPFQSNPQFSGLDSGYHELRVTDNNGCKFKEMVVVSRLAGPQRVTTEVLNTSCKASDGQIKVLSIEGETGPYQYALNTTEVNSTGIFTGLSASTYTLSVTDSAGCRMDTSLIVQLETPPSSANVIVNSDHCQNAIGFLSVDNIVGGKSPWMISVDGVSFFKDTIKSLLAGNYQLYIRDDNGCVLSMSSVEIKNEPGPVGMNVSVLHAICGKEKGEVEIRSVQGGVAPYLFRLDDGGVTTSTTINNISPGAHTITVQDAYGCSYTLGIQVDYIEQPKFELFPADTTICYDQLLQLILKGDQSRAKQINWSIPAQGTTGTIRGQDNTMVIVTTIDDNQCIQKDTAFIKVKPCNPPERCISVPNAFSPNRDGKNETIRPVANGCRISGLLFRIFNRWGQLLFESTQPGAGWDGYHNGLLQPVGSYVFTVHYTTDDGIQRQQKGSFMLVR